MTACLKTENSAKDLAINRDLTEPTLDMDKGKQAYPADVTFYESPYGTREARADANKELEQFATG